MENFPTKSFRSQGGLRFLRALASELNRKIVAIDLETANTNENSPLVEYAHLVINPADGTVASGWGLINPNTPIDAVMSQRHKVYEADVEGKPTIDAYAPSLTEIFKDAIVISGRDVNSAWTTLSSALQRAGVSAEQLSNVKVIDIAQLGIACPKDESNSPLQTFDRVMLACGNLSTFIFNNGAAKVVSQIAEPGKSNAKHLDASAESKPELEAAPASTPSSAKPRAPDQGAQGERVREWLKARIENNEVFPSWSQKFLIEKLLQKSPLSGGTVEANSSVFGFALADALKSGQLAPSMLIHPGLMKAMAPTLAALVNKPQLTLTEAQKSLADQTGRSFDYPMIRAALMVLGHPSYLATQKKNAPSLAGTESSRATKSRSPGM